MIGVLAYLILLDEFCQSNRAFMVVAVISHPKAYNYPIGAILGVAHRFIGQKKPFLD